MEHEPQNNSCNESEPYLPGHVTDEELAEIAEDVPLARLEIEAVRAEINTCGEEPAEVLLRAVSEYRVVALGEIHLGRNAHRVYCARMMMRLKAAGATHLALEIDAEDQPVLDLFADSGALDRGKLPCLLRDDCYFELLKAARQAGLKLVAADTRSRRWRDRHMADTIGAVLDADPQARVVFWVGGGHLLDRRGDRPVSTAAVLLREKYSVCTIKAQTFWNESGTLGPLTRKLCKPVAVRTEPAGVIGGLQDSFPFDDEYFERYRYWDYVFIYPPAYAMDD